jgi:ABC-type uncharacterized transport system permease subunit
MSKRIGIVERAVILLPLTLHGLLIYDSVFTGVGMRLGVGHAVSIIVWLAALIYWLTDVIVNSPGLHTLMMPIAAAGSLAPLVFPSVGVLPNTELRAFKLHLVISMLSYSLFMIASLHVLLMAVVERRLHSASLPAALRGLPPLLTMEIVLFRIIGVAFILLTLTLASGVIFSEELFGQPLQFNHKTIFGIASWTIFAALLGGRHWYGWRGKVAVRWTLTGFLMLILAYLGSKFVVEVLLGRG